MGTLRIWYVPQFSGKYQPARGLVTLNAPVIIVLVSRVESVINVNLTKNYYHT